MATSDGGALANNDLVSAACPDSLRLLARNYADFGGATRVRASQLAAASMCIRTAPGVSGLGSIADWMHSVASKTDVVAVKAKATADQFATADGRAKAYDARIASVQRQIAKWAPTNHDRTRAKVASDGKGHLLRFDPRHDGRVVEVFGDLKTATHVVVIVPGMDNDITSFPGLRKRAQALRAQMNAVARKGETSAVIMWLGYDTPDYTAVRLFTEGALSDKAVAGAKSLINDIAFYRKVNPTAHLTVIGHSYGTVVLGRAMRMGLDAKDAISVASPGMDADDRSELGSPTVKLWATRSRFRGAHLNDAIPLLPVHGEDPADVGFHAARFPSGGVHGHSGYFEPGTQSLLNLALISTGQPPQGSKKKQKPTKAPAKAAAKPAGTSG